MGEIGLGTANLWFMISNIALISGAVLAVVGTCGTVWMGSIREHHADIRSQTNERLTAEAKAEGARAQEQAAQATERAAAIEAQNLALAQTLERERSARLEMEGKLAARRLSADQRQRLFDGLARGRGIELTVFAQSHDAEATLFAHDLMAALSEAGCLADFQGGMYSAGLPVGLTISRNPAADGRRAEALITALAAAEQWTLPVAPVWNEALSPFHFELFVGPKPPLEG
jgi:hypothetical protein